MIKATDLRVGNCCNNGIVVAVHGDHIVAAGHYSVSGMATFQDHELRPDILTHEKLVEFNFSVNKNNGKVYDDNNVYDGYSTCYYFDTKQGFFYYNSLVIVSLKIEYIYQFQNMYHLLTGKEL